MEKVNGQSSLITFYNPKSPAAEAFRTLRTNIQFASPDKPLKTIMITSAGPAEGKSTVIANLAISMAQYGQKTIIVDADMRRPTQHKLFGIRQTPGLTNILVGQAKPEQALQETGIDNLLLLPSGPIAPNPSELLGSNSMDTLKETLQTMADMVIFDVPPAIAVTDAVLLAPRIDGVLLLMSCGAVQKEVALRAKDMLINVKANILGVVLNNVSGLQHYYYYYYYDQDDNQ